MRYTINVIGDHGEYEILMDQLRIHGDSNFARSAIRYFNRQLYLQNIHNRIPSLATRNIMDISPMYTEDGPLVQKNNELKWIAYFDEDNKYVVDIKRNQEVDMSTIHTIKERELSQMTVKAVCIKEGDLVTTRCKQSYKDVNYIWARFKRKKSKYCELVNGYWDTSFHDDENYKQLRDHLDAIWTVLQNIDVQDDRELKMNTRDGAFFEHDEEDEKNENGNDHILNVTIEGKTYELLWYNTLPIQLKKPRAHATSIRCISSQSEQNPKMYIMYVPKCNSQNKWQWYDNNDCRYIDYKQENELSQLECSYFANLEENYPNHVTKQDTHRAVHYFSHCLFTTLRHNLKNRKRYVLRYLVIQEEQSKLIVEQLAYSSKDNCFPREVRRITDKEFQHFQDEDLPQARLSRTMSTGTTFTEIVKRLKEILINYHQWLCSRSDLRKPGMLPRLAAIYECKESENPMIKLQNDFNTFMKKRDKKTLKEDETTDDDLAEISDDINTILAAKFKHQSTKCVCVERVYADKKTGGFDKERYFGFADPKEIEVQQTLDSYHCFFVHNHDIKINLSPDSRLSLKSHMSGALPQRMSSILSYSQSNRNRNIKFNTYETYDTGIRFYYWDYYKDNKQHMDKYQDRVTDPGNGKKYCFRDWFVVPAAANLKEEILAFENHIGMDQYNVLHQKVLTYLQSDHCHKLKCVTDDWEIKYGLKKGDRIQHEHVLAIRFYCCFTDAADSFIKSFIKQDKTETDDALKKRHSKCALWSKYLRECVEGFGTRLKRGRGVPSQYYRGITKKFLFKKTILRFNLPTSTSVTPVVADHFAADGGGDGFILRLKPHWGDYGGYIRAMNCCPFSDYQWEEEFIYRWIRTIGNS